MALGTVQYLKWPRVFFFLLTNALCVVTIGLSSWSLADSKDKERLAARTLPGAKLHATDIIGAGAGVAAASGLSALLCLGLLGYTLFAPRKVETLRSIRIKEGLFALVLIFLFATLVPSTLFMAQRSAYITAPGIPNAVIAQIVKSTGQSLAYIDQTPIKSFVAVGWAAFGMTLICLVLVSLAARRAHKDQNSTLPHHHDEHQQHEIGSVHEDRVSHEKFNHGRH